MEVEVEKCTKVLVTRVVAEAVGMGMTNAEALAEVRRLVPEAVTGANGVATMRSKVRALDPETPTSHAVRRERGECAKALIVDALRRGATNAEAVEEVLARLPDSRVTAGVVSWYRNALRARGENVPTGRQARRGLWEPSDDPKRVWDGTVVRFPVPPRRAPGEPTVASVAEAALRAWATDAEALAAVRSRLPDARTSADSIAFYRSRLRSRGEDVPTSTEARYARAHGGLDRAG